MLMLHLVLSKILGSLMTSRTLSETLPSGTSNQQTLAVIGAGIIGLCTALQAQRQGYQVTLMDKDLPGKGASFGNAGYLATELIDPLATVKTIKASPRLWLNPKGPLCLPVNHLLSILPWLKRFLVAASPSKAKYSQEALIQLNRESIPAWHRCLSQINAEEEIVESGYLLVWESSEKKEEARAHGHYMAQFDIPCEYVEGNRLAELEPELSQTLSHGLYFPQACRVKEPYQLCQRLFEAFKQLGGEFLQEAVHRIQPDNGQANLSLNQDNRLFDKAIICTGAWSKALLADLGLKVPLEAERGYHITATNQAHRIKHPIGSAERRFVITPLDSGLRAVGMTELGGLKRGPIARRFNVLKHHTQKLLPGLRSEKQPVHYENWMGHRPTLPDSLPVIDQHPDHPQLLFAFGNQHLGLTQAAATAELILSMAQAQTSFMPTHYFSVSRF